MSIGNIKVEGSGSSKAVNVAIDTADDLVYPLYKLVVGAAGEASLVSTDAPLPVSIGGTVAITSSAATSDSADVLRTQDTHNLLGKILKELQIMNLYNALAQDEQITREDI